MRAIRVPKQVWIAGLVLGVVFGAISVVRNASDTFDDGASAGEIAGAAADIAISAVAWVAIVVIAALAVRVARGRSG